MHHRAIVSLAAAAILAGCANTNPLVQWNRDDGGSQNSNDPMAAAKARATALLTSLEAKRQEQVVGAVDLNNWLLGLGLLTTGLAVGKVHRDAYTGTALLAGSAYLFGQQNLQRPRVSVYESGITAVNCALKAVVPVDLGVALRERIFAESAALNRVEGRLAAAIADAQARLAALRDSLSTDKAAAADAAIANAIAVRDAASITQGDVSDLVWRQQRAANELTRTIENIGEQVNKLASRTVADPASVQTQLAGLAAIAGRFAPGLGLQAAIEKSLKGITPQSLGDTEDMNDAAKKKSDPQLPARIAALNRSLDTLRAVADEAATLQRPLAKRLESLKGFNAADALKDCGVADVGLAIEVNPAKLGFKLATKQKQIVAVSGGIKPYVARLRDSDVEGVSVNSPLTGDSIVEVSVTDKVTSAQSLVLLVMDSANPRQMKELAITIGDQATPQGLTDRSVSGTATSTLAKGLLAMKDDKVEFQLIDGAANNSYTIAEVALLGPARVQLTLNCKRGTGKKLDSPKSVASQVLQVGSASGYLAGPDTKIAPVLAASPGQNCLAPK